MAISNTSILIKRSLTTGKPTSLNAGEFAYSYASNTLFFGTPGGTGVVNVGGQYYTSTLDAATNIATANTLVKRDTNGAFYGSLYGLANTANVSLYETITTATSGSYFVQLASAVSGNVSSFANSALALNAATGALSATSFTGAGTGLTGSAASLSIGGNAATATTLQNAQNFSISGGDISASAQSFNGSGAVTLNASLNNTGATAGTYGGTTAIPVVQVAANGRIISVSNATISTAFTVSGNTGSGSQAGGGTLTVTGSNGSGITSTVTGSGGSETITLSTDSTFVRTSGAQAINGDFSVTGNLIVTGSTVSINTATVQTNDSLIKLASNNIIGDIVDIGFYGTSNTGSSVQYHGLIREGSGGSNAGNFYLFKNLPTDPSGNVVNYASLTKATLIADLSGATGLPVSTGISGLGTGVASALSVNTGSSGAVVLYNGALGTPSSGTLTNASGLPIAGISGLGTGVATALGQTVTGSGGIALAQNPTFTGVANFTSINTASINVGTTTFVATGVLGSFQGSLNSYEQFIIQNSNNGSAASVDYIVSNDKSLDTGFYGDFGMNSSGFTGTGSLNLPNAVYVYSANSDLAIGTSTSNSIHFVVNSGATDAMTISSAGVVSLGTALGIASGGTNNNTFNNNTLTFYNGTGIVSLANVSFTATGTGTTNNTITSVTVDNFGRTSALTYSAIAGLTVGQGGTGVSSFQANGVVFGSTTGTLTATALAGAADQTWSNQILTVNNTGTPIWTSIMDGGSF